MSRQFPNDSVFSFVHVVCLIPLCSSRECPAILELHVPPVLALRLCSVILALVGLPVSPVLRFFPHSHGLLYPPFF